MQPLHRTVAYVAAALLSVFCTLGNFGSHAKAQILPRDFGFFQLWLDCELRGAVRFAYLTRPDTGSESRSSSFTRDPTIPDECQQTSTDSYSGAVATHRGHLVPANHLDFDAGAIKISNTMTNVLPQVARMNTGAWLQTEYVIECYRDVATLVVYGGVVWDPPRGDDFVESHGVETPRAYWKIVIVLDEFTPGGRAEWARAASVGAPPTKAIAWLIPNDGSALMRNTDKFVVDWTELTSELGPSLGASNIRGLPSPQVFLSTVAPDISLPDLTWADKSWRRPRDCDIG